MKINKKENTFIRCKEKSKKSLIRFFVLHIDMKSRENFHPNDIEIKKLKKRLTNSEKDVLQYNSISMMQVFEMTDQLV